MDERVYVTEKMVEGFAEAFCFGGEHHTPACADEDFVAEGVLNATEGAAHRGRAEMEFLGGQSDALFVDECFESG